jgi:sulfonate transport system substrate-binding protein
VNQNSSEAEHIVQKRTNYSDQIRDEFIALKRQYRVLPVTDTKFVAELQQAADWLVARKVLPESIKVSDHLASL